MKNTPIVIKAICESHRSTFITTASRFLGLSLVIFTISSSIVLAATGFDPTFGNAGRVISSPDGSEATTGQSMALQSDGKIVMVGEGTNLGIIVARYNANGSVDTTFGNNGWTSTSFGANSTFARSVAVQPDGKILVGASISTTVNSTFITDFAIARYNSNGSLDTTFDGDGKVTVSFSPEVIAGANDNFVSVKVAPDGKIIVGGYVALFPQTGRFCFARLNGDGSLDTTFGTNGRVIDSETIYKVMNDMVILPDGSIVAVGTAGGPNGGFRIAYKFNVNGGMEWSHGGSDGANQYPSLNGIAVQTDGKLIIVGSRLGRCAAFRLNADGTLDTSFNSPEITSGGAAISVAVQSDGKIVANFDSTGYRSFSLVRYNTNGTLDPGFGSGGIFNVRLTTGEDFGQKVLIQPDGKILVGGYTMLTGRKYFSIARFQNSTDVRRPLSDYDGDGKSDVSVYRPSNGGWYLNQSTNGFLGVQFGVSTDRIVPADYDGDGKTDIAIYRDGAWWILQSATNSVKAVQFGLAEDKPQRGDYDGDGRDDLAVFRPSTGVWYILRSSDSGFVANQWGVGTDVPQSGDYDGDGRADIAVFRPSNGIWYIQRSLGGNLFVQFGSNGDKPIAGDFDGDGKTDFAVWRAPTRQWFISNSSTNQTDIKEFGTSMDIPVPADYDGDGKADLAIFRPSNGGWYQMLSTQGSASQPFGLNGDLPTPGAFNF